MIVSKVFTLSTAGISPPPKSVVSIYVQFQLKKEINIRPAKIKGSLVLITVKI